MEKLDNPAVAIIEYKADRGVFVAYDRINKERIEVGEHLSFCGVLSRGVIKGYNPIDKSVYSSREYSPLEFKEPIEVMAYKDGQSSSFMKGIWKDIKLEAKNKGLAFHKVIYAMLLDDAGSLPITSIVKLELKGAGMKSWIDSNLKDTQPVKVSAHEEQTYGRVKFFTPKWQELDELSSDEKGAVAETADIVNKYFKQFEETPDTKTEEIPF